MKKLIIATLATIAIAGCSDSRVVSSNLSTAADNFELDRRIIFYNGITGEYLLSVEGRCSIFPKTGQLDVVCKTGFSAFKRHSLGISDNVTWFMEQLEPKDVSAYHYRVIFKPSAIIPDVEFK